jgi:hypothetical protein
MLAPRMDRIRRAIHADNLLRVERAARAPQACPMFVCHTVTDNLVWRFMEKDFVPGRVGRPAARS